MTAPTDRKYLKSHEWHKVDGDVVTIGITQFAADELTDILQRTIVPQFRRDDLSMADAERLERTMANLRDLTLEAIVNAFQRAADQVASKSMTTGLPGLPPR